MKILYNLDFSQKDNKYLHMEMTLNLSNYKEKDLILMMPVWSPGSYLVREYSGHLDCFKALGTNGEIPFQKIRKNQWRISLENLKDKNIKVKYRLYCSENTVRTNFIDDTHALIVPTATFLVPDDKNLAKYFEVKVNLPDDWSKISTGLDKVSENSNTFYSEDLHDFMDSPIQAGEYETFSFEVFGKPHHLAMIGPKSYNEKKIVEDIKSVVEETVKVIGDVPYEHYTFITHLTSGSTGGIEHKNSTVLHFNRWDFNDPEKYKRVWLSLVSHEYFHLWNVKRIKPAELVDFDYNNENYSRLLWLAEGFTSYFDDLIVRRANIYTEEEYLKVLASVFERLFNVPGRFYESLEDSSFDAWIKLYRKHDNTNNQSISYYVKGAHFGWALDFVIRKHSDNKKNLDDLMKLLWNDYKENQKAGYTRELLLQYAEKLAGVELKDMFHEFLNETREIDYDSFLNYAGLKLEFENKGTPTFNITVSEEKGQLVCTSVKDKGAGYQAGIMPKDEILAIDGYRVNLANYNKKLSQLEPDNSVKLLISRDERIIEKQITAASSEKKKLKISRVENPSKEQLNFYYNWIGQFSTV